VISGEPNPLEPLLFRLYDLFGENSPTMFVTRHASRAARGWPVESVRAAAALAAPTLADNVLPYARREIELHRAEGRAVVLATTTPRQILEPFAELLGFDDVIATNYGHDGDTFDGRVIGEFVWGRAKARAVAAWAAEHGVELGDSSAYSDSYYDVPLLSIVGRPHAVNPDPRLAMIAVLRRWPIRHFDLPSGVPKVGWVEPQRLILNLARAELMPWVRFQVHGVRRIPESGPAIIVGNHRSYFDPIAVGHLLARRGRPARFLGKKEVFDAPVVGDVARAMGGIRVERGTGSDEPLRSAEEVLAAGDMVAMMPQGTIPRGYEFFNPVLKGRWGAARLAAATGAPVIPVGLWGTERVWPRSSRLPNVTAIASPPTVTMRVGKPVDLEYRSEERDTERIMEAIMSLLPPEARAPREPTDEELARTLPPGVSAADVLDESTRRPGTD